MLEPKPVGEGDEETEQKGYADVEKAEFEYGQEKPENYDAEKKAEEAPDPAEDIEAENNDDLLTQ